MICKKGDGAYGAGQWQCIKTHFLFSLKLEELILNVVLKLSTQFTDEEHRCLSVGGDIHYRKLTFFSGNFPSGNQNQGK